MNKEDKKLDLEKYENELMSLRRISIQFNDLRKWLLNTSLATLAFAFTVMFQIKGGASLPYQSLAAASIILLILATIVGILIRGKNELEKLRDDSKAFYPFLPVIQDSLKDSDDISEEDKNRFNQILNQANTVNGKKDREALSKSVIIEIVLFILAFTLLFGGIGCLCFYIWMFLFG